MEESEYFVVRKKKEACDSILMHAWRRIRARRNCSSWIVKMCKYKSRYFCDGEWRIKTRYRRNEKGCGLCR